MDNSDIDTALDHCAAEPVHIPGIVQNHGAIVAIDNETLKVTHASENLAEVTGIDAEHSLGQTIYDVFPTGLRHDMVNNLLPSYLDIASRQLDPVELNGKLLSVGSAQAGAATIFEFEPARPGDGVSGNAMQQLAFLTSQLHAVETMEGLFEKSVRLLQVFTGFHRIMVYVFDSDGNGTVRAEALTGNLTPFLGLRFPAWDIPPQARKIMARTQYRCIADVDAQPVPVLGHGPDSPPLDMTQSHLRGVSEVHLRYLRNMGTLGSLTLNVVVDGALWGMISLHHEAPRLLDPKAREVCSNFIRFFNLKLDTILQRERLDRLRLADQISKELNETAASGDVDIRVNTKLLESITKAMRADGAILSKDAQLQSFGLVPPDRGIRALLELGETVDEPVHTAALVSDLPDIAKVIGPDIAGLHVTPMQGGNLVAFFRKDREQESTWAGVPSKEITGQGADARLQPRGSFKAYKETVQGTSDPWKPEDHQVASDVWSILINSERNALIEKTTRQQKILIDELNHRVRNILSLIRSLSRQSQDSAKDIQDYVNTLEARIEAVAAAHSLAVEQPTGFVSIHDILRLEAEAHNDAGTRVEIAGKDVGLNPEVVPIFALVIHELMTNAAKYGALATATGQVSILLVHDDDTLKLNWRENGGPPVKPPVRQGFGTDLLNNAVQNELRGQIEQDFAPDGFVARLTLPGDMLSTAHHYMKPDAPEDVARDGIEAGNQSVTASRSEQSCLLLDDSFVVSLDTMRILNAVGFEDVQTAMTINDARQVIARKRPAFAVLDVNLSAGHTSLGIARDLMELDVPFVFVTGYGGDGVPKDLFPDARVLTKPLRRLSLEQVLHEMGL